MSDALERINQANSAKAESMFRDCCGSTEWARRMTAARPFASEIDLLKIAVTVWNDIEVSDWLEAFASHPKIGETKAAGAQENRSAEWSASEQAGMNSADAQVRDDLAKANREYFDKFGFIYIVCATGKDANEMLASCRLRLNNDPETEIAIAAAEQQKITEIRLKKLLSP